MLTTNEILLEALKHVHQSPKNSQREWSFGICFYVLDCLHQLGVASSDLDIIEERMDKLFRIWPHYSGDLDYPVPGEDSSLMSPREEFDYHLDNNLSMWDKSTEYGQLRWDLLEFMIKELEDNDAN